MGVNYFTDEQVKILKTNPNVKNVSNKAITYTDSFKEYFVNEYNKGKVSRSGFYSFKSQTENKLVRELKDLEDFELIKSAYMNKGFKKALNQLK